jgi:hypothetical protein
MEEVMGSMGLVAKFSEIQHVTALNKMEVMTVLRELDLFEMVDLPRAVAALDSSVPVEKLCYWLEMAKLKCAEGAKFTLEKWQIVLDDHSGR